MKRCESSALGQRGRCGWAVAVAVVLLGASPAGAQWQKNKYELEKEWAAQYEPAPFLSERKIPGAASGGPSVVRVRFYADGEYRAAGHWQDAIKRQLGEMNAMLGPAFGVRLEAESLRRWERGGANGALNGMLKDLVALDRGGDVDWVVGLVSPLPLVSMSFHDLGLAEVLGRHFVVRGMSSVAELDAFNQVFQALDRDQREKMYGRRKAHKEMSVFLHEWAHTLGAFHVPDPTAIMGPGYSQRSSRFSYADADLVAAGVQARLASRGADEVDWTPLRERLTQTRSPTWPSAEVAWLEATLARLASQAGATKAGKATGFSASPTGLSPAAAALGLKAPPPPAERALAARAQQALDAGRGEEARAAVTDGLRASPRSPDLLAVACDLELRDQQIDKAARLCSAALTAYDRDAKAHRLMGRIHHQRKKTDAAIASLTRAIELDPSDRGTWEFLGEVYRSAGRSRDYQRFLIDHAELAPAQ